MGAHPYWYVVKYNGGPEQALEELCEREFRAGRYNPVIPFPEFPVTDESPTPGAEHDSIADALADSDADGTRSILDICGISEQPDFFFAAPLADEVLLRLFGTTRPTQEVVMGTWGFFDDLERGHAIYIVLYRDDQPDEILFAGYSFD